jgi:hypothetical protein
VSSAVVVTRVGDRTLRIRPENGYLEHEPERMLRSLSNPFHAGDVVRLPGLTITVDEVTADGRPADAVFRFDVPLEDPSLVWMYWTRNGLSNDGYDRWTLPAVGETVHLPAHDFRHAILDVDERLSRRR